MEKLKNKYKFKNLKNLQEELEIKLKKELLSNPSEENFKAVYDELHTFFLKEAKNEELYSSELRWFSKIFLKKIGSGKKVLDIGTGNGKLAFALANKGNKVIAIDISNIALETAKKKLEKLNESNSILITFQYGDARKLDFPGQCFDFVVSHDLIEHLSENDFSIHLNEVERVLKLGGSYLFWTPSRLRGGSSLGLHLKEYTVKELDSILRSKKFLYSWIDLRLFKFKIILEFPQKILPIIIWYEKMIGLFIKYIPKPLKKILVPPLFFCLSKIE